MLYYNPPDKKTPSKHSIRYICNHPVYDECTVFIFDEKKGIAVIQQRYDPLSKHTWWGPIDDWIADDIYSNSGFLYFLAKNAKEPELGLYPTFTVRQVMRRIGMPPIRKEPWETRF
jgi:hypothetical protein